MAYDNNSTKKTNGITTASDPDGLKAMAAARVKQDALDAKNKKAKAIAAKAAKASQAVKQAPVAKAGLAKTKPKDILNLQRQYNNERDNGMKIFGIGR